MAPSDVAPESTDAPPTRIDRYEIEGVIGRGGFGTVYRAQHVLTKQRVALKALRMSALAAGHGSKDLVREAQIMGAIRHKNIVAVYDAGIADGMAFFAMELAEGRTLEDLLVSHGAMPIAQLMPLAQQLAEGLAAAHALGVVHRDIKPANLIVLADGTLKIADFGISRSTFASQTAPSQRALAGTPGYMAPELFGDGPTDLRVDIYAAAATLFHASTGALPFQATSFAELLPQVTTQSAPSLATRLPSAPAFFVQAVDRGLARDPNARFGSADELRAALLGRASFAAPTISGLTPSGTAATIASLPPAPAAPIPTNPPPTNPPPPVSAAPVASAGSPMKWALIGGLVVLVVLAIGVAAGVALQSGRIPLGGLSSNSSASASAPSALPPNPSSVVIGPVRVIERSGKFTTTQRCDGTQTLRYVHSTIDVKDGPAFITDDACDLELEDCEVHGVIGIKGRQGDVKIARGSITAKTVGIELERGRILVQDASIAAPWGVHVDGDVKLTHVSVAAKETALNVSVGNLDVSDTDLSGLTALHYDNGNATFRGGRIRGNVVLDGVTSITAAGTTLEGNIAKKGITTIHGLPE
jgi:serine/threonine-protein kinase